ncbi:hypothetical protein BGW37DRAFT_491750 [Umbelopsis sp. PMI_123]|nr:hypothetical protein BGW37DRAFT_491750 [Umbelopsis sp. PMI_123]
MKIKDMLNPPRKISIQVPETSIKPRSRFSQLEDAVICEGVAKGLSWGEISAQLPHRKRATCFNRYYTLMGKRRPHKRRASSVDSTATSSSPPSPPLTPDANIHNFETAIRKKTVHPPQPSSSSDTPIHTYHRHISAYIYKKSTSPAGQTKPYNSLFRRKSTGF